MFLAHGLPLNVRKILLAMTSTFTFSVTFLNVNGLVNMRLLFSIDFFFFNLNCSYTADEDFLNADAVFDFIGDPPEERFDLAFCGSLLEKQYVSS